MKREGHRWTGVAVVSILSLIVVEAGFVGVTLQTGLAIGVALLIAYVSSSVPDQFERWLEKQIGLEELTLHRNDLVHSVSFAVVLFFTVFGLSFVLQLPLFAIASIFFEAATYPLWLVSIVAGYVASVLTGVVILHIFVDTTTAGKGGTMIKPFWPLLSSTVTLGLYTSDTDWINKLPVIIGKIIIIFLFIYFNDIFLFDGALMNELGSIGSRLVTRILDMFDSFCVVC